MSAVTVAPLARASAVEGGVAVVLWPEEQGVLADLSERGTPRLLLVEDGSRPPVGADCCQDWMWRSGDEHELRFRVQQLGLRALGHETARPELDELGVLHVGLRSVALAPKERILVGVLLRHFAEVVPRDELVAEAWPDGIRAYSVFASRLSVLRSRLAVVDLEIVGSPRDGYLLRAVPSSVAPHVQGGFDDELGPGPTLLERAGAPAAR